jgi:hypothetical protein
MRALLLLPILFGTAAEAQTYNPTERYIIPGQDDPGYRAWYLASPTHPIRIAGLHHYLTRYGAGWILPTWQIVRTASDWSKCGEAAFEVPPTSEWPHIVQTLRFVRDEVIPVVGPVEAVSTYRNPRLNAMDLEKLTDRARGFLQAAQTIAVRETTSGSRPRIC